MLPDEDELPPYRVEAEAGQFVVRARSGLAILSVRDAASAEHYVELLNRAFQAGFKVGYRQARKG